MKAALMLGVNSEFEREKNDYYATDPYGLKIFIPHLRSIGLHKNVWECSCGEGHLSKVLESNGYNVYSSDLIDRGYGIGNIDFLKQTEKWEGDILTNPPFKLASEFVKKGMELLEDGNKMFLFLKVQFLEGTNRKETFKKYPPKYIYVNSERISCAMNGEFDKYFKQDKKCKNTYC